MLKRGRVGRRRKPKKKPADTLYLGHSPKSQIPHNPRQNLPDLHKTNGRKRFYRNIHSIRLSFELRQRQRNMKQIFPNSKKKNQFGYYGRKKAKRSALNCRITPFAAATRTRAVANGSQDGTRHRSFVTIHEEIRHSLSEKVLLKMPGRNNVFDSHISLPPFKGSKYNYVALSFLHSKIRHAISSIRNRTAPRVDKIGSEHLKKQLPVFMETVARFFTCYQSECKIPSQ
ncbi:hypothetical protein DICVIV_04729 [Dictyocaulus viviparus]|uniref:Uncharacterized protein n=1 Tax=Dictyocaulus viviparus TaxID=29172 RepID=A0A0D8XXG1_DICVI|nr:hypothetical protein DICVIV_04729 [Dictyocaulus viviparus]